MSTSIGITSVFQNSYSGQQSVMAKRLSGLRTLRTRVGKNKKVIDKYINEIEIADAIQYGNLKIFPLTVNQDLSTKNYVTLDEASEKNWLTIKELKTARVNTVEIQNNGTEPVFIMTGEVIKGAKQDRMLQQDILLPPHGTWIKVPVYCVEHGRWRHVSAAFESADKVVPSSVRKTAEINEDQQSVWSEISALQKKSGISSSTGTIMANYEDENAKKKIDEYTKEFENIPHVSEKTIGVVVTTGDTIVCFDLFANNNLLQKLWKKLVKSYALDGISGTKSIVGKKDIEDFISKIDRANKFLEKTPGLGDKYKLESGAGKGSALVGESSVIHMDFFLGQKTIDKTPYMCLEARQMNRLGSSLR